MATDLGAGVATPARLRGPGARTFERPVGKVSTTLRRRQHPGLLPDHARSILPPAAPPGEAGAAQAAVRDDAEEPAQIAAGLFLARSIHTRRLLPGHRRRGLAGRRRAGDRLQR